MEEAGDGWTQTKRLFSADRDTFDSAFAKRMSAAGISPDDRIGIAISGGSDSTALSILCCRWICSEKHRNAIEAGNVVGLIVDHGLRPDSGSEASLVQNRVFRLGIKCEVLKCFWTHGMPAQGHLQEAARNARYELLQEACIRNGLRVLVTAHHADDQMELFVIRLSRCSGLAGLAGMPYVSEMFRCIPEGSQGKLNDGLLLVRPLLDFSKSELQYLCRKYAQPWVEDPSNSNIAFLRNMVRNSLTESPFDLLRNEILHLISLCRQIRAILDKGRDYLLLKAVSINQDFGYAIMDLGKLSLNPNNEKFLSRAIVATLQFVAQKDKPPRGKVVDRMLKWMYSCHLKGTLTLAGCNMCAAPGSKGSKVIICVSCDSRLPLGARPVNSILCCDHSFSGEPNASQMKDTSSITNTFRERALKSHLNIPFINMKDSTHLISEANHEGILSDCSTVALSRLISMVSMGFNNEGDKSNKKKVHKIAVNGGISKVAPSDCSGKGLLQLPLGHALYFMNRFMISWGRMSTQGENFVGTCFDLPYSSLNLSQSSKVQGAGCIMEEKNDAWVRCLNEKDWILLSHIAKRKIAEACVSQAFPCREDFSGLCPQQASHTATDGYEIGSGVIANLNGRTFHCGNMWASGRGHGICNLPCCGDFVVKKAQEAFSRLKNIPVPVRKGLPVIITAQGALLGIPSLHLSMCPKFWVSSSFCPKVPLGGGHTSWL